MSGILDFSAKCFVGCGLALAMIGPYSSAHANETVLHSFCSRSDCRDGEAPEGGVIMDSSGNLYGTTSNGGANWGGNVFEITPDGTYKVLYSFCSRPNCKDGSSPNGSLIMDSSGKLYGTTFAGGTGNCFGSTSGLGTVFSIDATTGAETVLYNFSSKDDCSDGENPAAGVIMDGSGNLYGTTEWGGATSGYGTVFKLARNGKEKVLYSFGSTSNDGLNPTTGLVLDSAGNLYGTTVQGGAYEYGNVYEVTPDRAFKLLHSFCSKPNCSDGAHPWAGLILDSSGNLYGTTQNGGVNDYGTVFKLAASGAETVLYNLCSRHDCSDGAFPAASLIMDGSGNLFGTTQFGVGRDCSDNPYVCGAVFKLAPNGTETTLYSFCSRRNCGDGGYPAAGLIMDGPGKLYGTTVRGGTGHCIDGCGTVFKLDQGISNQIEGIPVKIDRR